MKLYHVSLIFFALAIFSSYASGRENSFWQPARGHILTRWAKEVSPENSLPEYPRPQMVRSRWSSLNGLWNYAVTPRDSSSFGAPDGRILVPFSIESSLSGVGRSFTADDALWYETSFKVPSSWRRSRVLLHFGAVDWDAQVFVNGRFVTRHTGGYTSFTCDITPYLAKGSVQSLRLKVLDATDDDFQPCGKQSLKAKPAWYTPVSGIWQSVWMEPVPQAYVVDYLSVSDLDSRSVSLTVETAGTEPGDMVVAELLEGGIGYDTANPGRKVLARTQAAPGRPLGLKVEDVHLWSPDSPYLYGLAISLVRNGRTLDKVQAYTAMRSIGSVRDSSGVKRMALNGEPVFQFGPLDQGWFPDGLYTAPTDEALKYDIEMAREYGFNMIRKHMKVEPDRWYWHCDRLGMLVWQDMPSYAIHAKYGDWIADGYDMGNEFPASDGAKANFYKEWSEIIAGLKKFQCIVCWVPFNEAWGQFDTKDVVAFTYAQDSTRLVNMASGGNWISGGCGDILDTHYYPEPHIRLWDPDMIVVLGEYGGIALPVEGHLWKEDANWGYVKYDNAEAVTDEYVRFAEMLVPLAEEGVCAAVYTQTTDVEGEINGLMTYDREVNKLDVARVRSANRAVIEAVK